jgi:hypothetical protein
MIRLQIRHGQLSSVKPSEFGGSIACGDAGQCETSKKRQEVLSSWISFRRRPG